MKKIPLTQGKFAIVDDEDYDRVVALKWYAHLSHKAWYAVRDNRKNGHREWLTMSRFILRQPQGVIVDHINRKAFDNRKKNLRMCSCRQNSRNRKCGYGSSLYKGVSYHKGELYKGKQYKGWWVANIRHYGKNISLGCFRNEIEAAKAYDQKAKELFGEFAYLNFSKDWREKGK